MTAATQLNGGVERVFEWNKLRPERLPNSLALQTTLVRMRVLWSRGQRGSRNVPLGQNVSLQSHTHTLSHTRSHARSPQTIKLELRALTLHRQSVDHPLINQSLSSRQRLRNDPFCVEWDAHNLNSITTISLQYMSNDDCPQDKMEDYHTRSLCCVVYDSCAVICTHVSSAHRWLFVYVFFTCNLAFLCVFFCHFVLLCAVCFFSIS